MFNRPGVHSPMNALNYMSQRLMTFKNDLLSIEYNLTMCLHFINERFYEGYFALSDM